MYRLLIIEDEKGIAESIADNLSNYGFETRTIDDFSRTMEIFKDFDPHMVLLDIKLPYYDGYHYCAEIRKLSKLPIIFISSASDNMNIIMAMNMGGDDFITKPFEMVELLARVETVMRRYHKASDKIQIDDVVIDISSRTVMREKEQISLTMKEYELLLLFARNPNIALYRETIYENVWGSNYMGDSRTVDLHVQRLRKKMNWEDKIKAVYKVGYRLEI